MGELAHRFQSGLARRKAELSGRGRIRAGDSAISMTAPGDYRFAVSAPRGVLEFELDRARPPSAEDALERGVVVRSVELRPSRVTLESCREL